MVETLNDVNPIDLLRELERRAMAAAAELPEAPDQPSHWRGIGFRVSEHRLVMEMGDVREVLHVPKMARVPGTKSWIRGLASLRGALLPVVDLSGLLLGRSTAQTREARVLVIQEPGVLVGLMVEEVFGLQQFANDAFEHEKSDGADSELEFIEGRFTTPAAAWQVFNVKALVRASEFSQAAA